MILNDPFSFYRLSITVTLVFLEMHFLLKQKEIIPHLLKKLRRKESTMWVHGANPGIKVEKNSLVAVAVDKDKGSQYALKWAVNNILTRGQTVILIHVQKVFSSCSVTRSLPYVPDSNIRNPPPIAVAVAAQGNQNDKQVKDLFLSFHCYCSRKEIHCLDITLEGAEVAKTLTDYASFAAIQNLVLGSSSSRHSFLRRFKGSDTPTGVSKSAPDFCTVYVISKGKISSVRNACRLRAPHESPLLKQIQNQAKQTPAFDASSKCVKEKSPPSKPRSPLESHKSIRAKELYGSLFADTDSETDISFVSSGRASLDIMSPSTYHAMDSGRLSVMSTGSNQSFGSQRLGVNQNGINSQHRFSSISVNSACSSENIDDVEAEMRRLKLELKQTMDLYGTACREALAAKQKATELSQRRNEEVSKLEEARHAEEAALKLVEKEREKCRAAMEQVEAQKRIALIEAQKRANAERGNKTNAQAGSYDNRYRKYTIEEIEKATDFFSKSKKIGEGGYGPVFKCYLNHTQVAVKVLRPDAEQGMLQFQQEIEVLSCIRHPNMVLLLGACPEYGCLVYEYLANGSLDDRLFRRGNTPVLCWQIRFRIAEEIATGLLFLHQTKPEPIVHRDLKPGNILLDHNYVSKISDVGLARLVPPSVAENVTQYRLTATAGTFCYIDPEYQQTGMLGVKSDVYSLGILLLQIITAKSPMGLTHIVERSIEDGTFFDILDPAVPDWPIEETVSFAKLALRCSELRRKDRPDLGTIILPELNRLRTIAEQKLPAMWNIGTGGQSPCHSHSSIIQLQEVISDPLVVESEDESSN